MIFAKLTDARFMSIWTIERMLNDPFLNLSGTMGNRADRYQRRPSAAGMEMYSIS